MGHKQNPYFVIVVLATFAPAVACAASVTPLYTNSAGGISQVTANVASYGIYTPVINSSGKLEVIAWNDTGTALIRTGSASAGTVKAIASEVIYTGTNFFLLTAVVNGSGYLKIIAWEIVGTTITRASSYTYSSTTMTAVSISRFDVASGATRFVTASRNSSGNLDLEVWSIDDSGTIALLSAYIAGAVSQVTATSANQNQFVTFVKNGSGNLEGISWYFLENIDLINQQASITAGAVKRLASAQWNSTTSSTTLATAVVNGSGNLEVIGWQVDTSGQFTRTGSQDGEAASQVAICVDCGLFNPGVQFTAIKDSAGDLGAELWSIQPVQELALDDTRRALSP